MKGQWCTIDKNKFCQENDCKGCQVNYFGDGWMEYQPPRDEIVVRSITSRQVNVLNILTDLSH